MNKGKFILSKIIIVVSLILFNTGCNTKEFNHDEWTELSDVHTYNWEVRKKMAQYLIEEDILINLTKSQVIEMLGEDVIITNFPENQMQYTIYLDYGSDIDPVKIESLTIIFNPDNIVKEVKREFIKK